MFVEKSLSFLGFFGNNVIMLGLEVLRSKYFAIWSITYLSDSDNVRLGTAINNFVVTPGANIIYQSSRILTSEEIS